MCAFERQIRDLLPDQFFKVRRRTARYLRFRNSVARPTVADEKYYWRKALDHDPRFIICSDKLATKAWVARLGLDVEVPRTLWASDDPETLPPDLMAPEVIVKANHGTAMNTEFKGGGRDDRARIVEGLRAQLGKVHGKRHGEWAYAPIRRRVFAEERLFPGREMCDLKLYTFGPRVEQIVPIYHGAQKTAAIWDRQDGGDLRLNSRKTAVSPVIDRRPLPEITTQAEEVACRIGAYFDHMRVDFMTDGTRLYLGELTVYNLGGRAHLVGHLPQACLTRSWDLRRTWFMNTPQQGWRAEYAAALRDWLDAQALENPYLASSEPLSQAHLAFRYEDFAPA